MMNQKRIPMTTKTDEEGHCLISINSDSDDLIFSCNSESFLCNRFDLTRHFQPIPIFANTLKLVVGTTGTHLPKAVQKWLDEADENRNSYSAHKRSISLYITSCLYVLSGSFPVKLEVLNNKTLVTYIVDSLHKQPGMFEHPEPGLPVVWQ